MALVIEQPLTPDLTTEAGASLRAAERHASRAGAALVEPEHLLLGLLDPMGPALRILLANLRVDSMALAAPLRERLGPGIGLTGPTKVAGFADAAQSALDRAAAATRELDAPLIDSKHLLLGLLGDPRSGTASLLRGAGLTAKAVRQQLQRPGLPTVPIWRDVLAAVRPSPIFLALAGIFIGSGVGLVLAPPERAIRPLTFAFILSGWILSLCIHEFGHALAGYLGGDRSVAKRGLLTLDPRRYTDPLLSIGLPLLFFLIGGIPLPGGSVWIDRRMLRSERWGQIVSASGPLGTLVCLVLTGLPFLLGLEWRVLPDAFVFWSALAGLGQLLAIVLMLNLLPIPPLDGFQLIARWLPPTWRNQAYALGWMPVFLLFIVLRQPSPLQDGYWSLIDSVSGLFHIPLWLAYEALDLMRLG